MTNFVLKTTRKCYDDSGIGAAILAIILCLAIVFGILCGISALFMVCWNGAVVPAISVCNPMGFWQAMVFIFAGDFFFSWALPSRGSKSNYDEY